MKCATNNDEDATYCTECGAALNSQKMASKFVPPVGSSATSEPALVPRPQASVAPPHPSSLARDPWWRRIGKGMLAAGSFLLILLIYAFARYVASEAFTFIFHPKANLYQEAKDAEDHHDYAKAIDLLRQACNDKSAVSCNDLGVLYLDGTGIPQDYDRAQEFLSKACDAGNARGCENLGAMYADGTGVTRDPSRGAELYKVACDAGVPDSCGRLGIMYANGKGVEKDDSRAATLLVKACESLDGSSCSALGTLYLDGRGVKKDSAKARQFLSQGCNLGDQNGCDQMKYLP
jgi:TPR repeat protein